MSHQYTNKLINESSPYLLQHAHNPVNWFPWGDEALEKARKEDKPILVSIGYAACHWCHVMERESFEDETTARIMNDHFINIKIDREERPDLDHIYMDAVQAMTGSGGWPLNIFLTPDRKPFYGGTYFPPRQAFNRPSWQETLYGVIQAFREKRHEIEAQAENLTQHIVQSNAFGMQPPSDAFFNRESSKLAYENIMKAADTTWGGFGRAPKFPQSFTIQYLLRYYYSTGEKEALNQALLSLDKMIDGGIYDQLGGGFARYSTDTEWLAPHFEKMLYDNALLVAVAAEAFQLTKLPRYRTVIADTMAFIQRELMYDKKGFYAALDADSEGVEGKYYVWSKEEVDQLLGDDSSHFCGYYDITEKGNWEHTNILWVKKPLSQFAAENDVTEAELTQVIESGKAKLMAARAKRVPPLLDDKLILGWNALVNTACSKAFAATGDNEYRELAKQNMTFLLETFTTGTEGRYHHTWKEGQAKYPAFLDDYAYLVQALLHLQEITGDRHWLEKARSITQTVIRDFSEEGSGYFMYTPVWQQDVIVRKKEVYDGATPSGNAVMAMNLWRLAILYDKPEWRERAGRMVGSLGNAITRYPTSFGNWACLMQEMISGTEEIVLIGADCQEALPGLLAEYIPHRVLMASGSGDDDYPLLTGREALQKTTIYLCRNNTCLAPVFSTSELISLINREQNRNKF
ncbi:MAG: thioredoxin domain-containing protein [Chitinophagaceae bacterium]|nr:thioredoxin domain-containing protein [Chitinophagaceae bacterium]